MRKKSLVYLVLVVLLLISGTACQKDAKPSDVPVADNSENEGNQENQYYPIAIVDDAGNEIEIKEEPKKIASAVPSNTEIIYALGAEDKLVGVTEFCNYPEEAKNIASIGDYNGLNIEKVIELDVDILFASYISDDIKSQLEQAGIKVFVIEPSNIESVYKSINDIGKVLHKEDEANELIDSMKKKQNEIINIVSDLESKRVFFEVWHDPIMSAGPGSLMDEMITMVNGENVAGDAASSYPEYSLELLIEKNPEVYITADDGFKTVEDVKARENFNQISAVINERIYFLDQDIIVRPGPRIIDGLEMIAKAIHPKLFLEK